MLQIICHVKEPNKGTTTHSETKKKLSSSLQRIKMGTQHHSRELNVNQCTIPWSPISFEQVKCTLRYYPPKHIARGVGKGLFPPLSLWVWRPRRAGDGKTEIVVSTQNFSYPVQQQGVPHSLIYLLSHCAMLQQEHFPSSSSHVCNGWKMQAEDIYKKKQPLKFCNRVVSPQVSVPT